MMIDGIGDALKLGTKITNVLEKLLTDTRIRERFEKEGRVSGLFSICDYQVDFTITDRSRIIEAEIETTE